MKPARRGPTLREQFPLKAKAAVVEALRRGTFEHEARDALFKKNLLAVGAVDENEVARLVLRTRSDEYGESRHHWDRSVIVHTFKPTAREEWQYIKVYFIETDRDDPKAMFISVHRAGS